MTERNNSANILMVLDILQKYSDENNPLTQVKIEELVNKDYPSYIADKSITYKAVGRNLKILCDFLENNKSFGYTLEYRIERKRKNKQTEETEELRTNFYLERNITDTELRFLIDCIIFSKGINIKHGQDLINKLKRLSGNHFFPKKQQQFAEQQQNEQFFILLKY